MADPRRQVRVLALQALCHLDAQGDEGLRNLESLLSDLADHLDHVRPARRLVLGAWTARDRYDGWVQQVSEHWDLTRISSVERSILRLAIHELIDCRQPPAKVAINEAIELAREFAAGESAAFVNGILDAVWHQHADESIKNVEQQS